MSTDPLLNTPSVKDYRDAMARLGAAVHVVTTDGPGGRAGFTATAVCSVTDSPPTLLVCLNRSSSAHAVVVTNGVVCVNTLAADQMALSQNFGGKLPMAERFAEGEWSVLESGAPVLGGAIAAFDCRVSEMKSVGSHDILICEALAIRCEDAGSGLLYVDRQYHVPAKM